MHSAAELEFHSFDEDCFDSLGQSRQLRYVYCYLRDLGAASVLVEPHYFDKDYLSEFAAFYSVSARGYPNTCRRMHFFSVKVDRKNFTDAVSGEAQALHALQDAYLGFSVIRPIAAACLGSTVLAWYPDSRSATRRVTTPSREYRCHVAGIALSVVGLAWQQQDSAVGACATVGLWSMLHASSFDNDHSAPTTAQITEAAHQTAVTGARVFPSNGLTIIQLLEAIKRYHMAPFVMSGDIQPRSAAIRTDNIVRSAGFSKERFASTCASFIRSGYPVLAIGHSVGSGRHAVCITGFREQAPGVVEPQAVKAADESIIHVYIHDDNLGPNVRFAVTTRSRFGQVVLSPDPPYAKKAGVNASPTLGHPAFVPQQLVVCTHEDLRTSPDKLNGTGLKICADVSSELNRLLEHSGMEQRGLLYSCRFMLLRDYLKEELASLFVGDDESGLLGRIRLEIVESVVPMSKHIGVVRISLQDSTPLLDVLYDTSDSDLNHPVFAHLSFGLNVCRILEGVKGYSAGRFGVQIRAF
ncbi:hypothetical protein OAM69_02220 [bacterium]|nr:hypothetical protein [bacterium]